MKFKEKIPPREFVVGYDNKNTIKDCGSVELTANEQITFVTELGNEYDVARKDWGFYATPSLNGRLSNFQLRAVLVKNRINRFFIMLVEKGKEELFQQYVNQEPLTIVCWMDTLEHLQMIEQKLLKESK
ncbi:MAG TPA: hypothetical protein VJN02_11190 [Gammaproteobacteria bacterium]|nr:hypothetical protein [Gammaproteobacteria bacterium]